MLPNLDGHEVFLSSLRGKVVLLDFWGTWCVPCRHELPDMQRLFDRYRSRGLVVLGMTETSPAGDVRQVRKSLHLTFPMAMVSDKVAQSYNAGPEGLPTAVLVDRHGKVVGRLDGLDPAKRVSEYWPPLIEKALNS